MLVLNLLPRPACHLGTSLTAGGCSPTRDRLPLPPSTAVSCTLWAGRDKVGATVAGEGCPTPCFPRPAPPGSFGSPQGLSPAGAQGLAGLVTDLLSQPTQWPLTQLITCHGLEPGMTGQGLNVGQGLRCPGLQVTHVGAGSSEGRDNGWATGLPDLPALPCRTGKAWMTVLSWPPTSLGILSLSPFSLGLKGVGEPQVPPALFLGSLGQWANREALPLGGQNPHSSPTILSVLPMPSLHPSPGLLLRSPGRTHVCPGPVCTCLSPQTEV